MWCSLGKLGVLLPVTVVLHFREEVNCAVQSEGLSPGFTCFTSVKHFPHSAVRSLQGEPNSFPRSTVLWMVGEHWTPEEHFQFSWLFLEKKSLCASNCSDCAFTTSCWQSRTSQESIQEAGNPLPWHALKKYLKETTQYLFFIKTITERSSYIS